MGEIEPTTDLVKGKIAGKGDCGQLWLPPPCAWLVGKVDRATHTEHHLATLLKKLDEELPCPLLAVPVVPLLGTSPKENRDASRHLFTVLTAAS